MKLLPLNFMRYARDPGAILRNYYSLKIEHLDESVDSTVLSSMTTVASCCQSLKISYSTFTNSESFAVIFNSLKLLKELILVRVEIAFDGEIENFDRKLKLKKLELVQVDHKILKFMTNIQVVKLAVIDGNNRTDGEALVNFLSHQNFLESLAIENLSHGASVLFDNDESRQFRFKLTKLSTLFSHIHNMEMFDVNFTSFLKLHETTLKQLKVEGSLSPQIYKFIVANFKSIDELEINVGELPQESSFYDHLKPNRSLSILKLNGTVTKSNLNGFKGIASHYPNVERVSIADTDCHVANDAFHILSVRLRQLNHLSVLNLHETFAADAVFPSLKHFSIRILNNVAQWKSFITKNASVESLNVGWVKRDQFTPEIIHEITNLPHLRHLRFGGRFIASKRIYDAIKSDYKRLRTLELMVANYEEIKNLKFVFPLDQRLWLPRCEYFDEGSDREPLND